MKKILVLAPHTDDGELGCGGTISRLIGEGAEIFYAAFSDCRKSLPAELPPETLRTECVKATELLGIKKDNLIFFDFEVREFMAQRQAILEEMVSLNKTIKPDLVFTPASADVHQDHQVIYSESLRAFKSSSILGYELPWNNTDFRMNHFIKISKENMDAKMNALKAYSSQMHRSYFADDFILSLATVRGVQSGTLFAEAFETYKMII